MDLTSCLRKAAISRQAGPGPSPRLDPGLAPALRHGALGLIQRAQECEESQLALVKRQIAVALLAGRLARVVVNPLCPGEMRAGKLRPRKRPRARNSRGLYCSGHVEALS